MPYVLSPRLLGEKLHHRDTEITERRRKEGRLIHNLVPGNLYPHVLKHFSVTSVSLW